MDKYTLTVHYRNGESALELECGSLDYGVDSVFQTIKDLLQINKDHWNITRISIDWEPPREYESAEKDEEMA